MYRSRPACNPHDNPKGFHVGHRHDQHKLVTAGVGPPEQSCCVACPSVGCCCLQGCPAQEPANWWPGVPQISSQG